MNYLQGHFERIEKRLTAEGELARSFDHSLHKGHIREAFVREFLGETISELWGVGTGEVLGSTEASSRRRQIDVVIHNRRYPKISLSAGTDLFFLETISSFVEIKSNLTKEHVRKAAQVTQEIKSQVNPDASGTRPYSFIFAYRGPKRIKTVRDWIREISKEDDYNLDQLASRPPSGRPYFLHSFIDGVFTLGTGFVVVDALPFRSAFHRSDRYLGNYLWTSDSRVLEYLWALVNQINGDQFAKRFQFTPYLGHLPLELWVDDE